MGLRPKKELFSRYFLTSQLLLLLGSGMIAFHGRYHRQSVEQSAKDEIPNTSIFNRILDSIFPSSFEEDND